jgi:non-heme chloroperoxidase
VPLTHDDFRYAFANMVSEVEAKHLHETYAVPAPGLPVFQAAAANFNPGTEAQVDTKDPGGSPLLFISGEGEKDHTVPWAVTNAAFKRQQRNKGVTEFVEVPAVGSAHHRHRLARRRRHSAGVRALHRWQ